MYDKIFIDGGLRIITSYMPHTKSASLAFFLGTGSRYETEREAGISHFLEHMCFKGSSWHPTTQEISETIEGMGGSMNAATDRELTTYWCKVPYQHCQQALDILSGIILDPLLDKDEMEKERQVILEELSMTYDVPSYRADLLMDQVMWPDQPLGRDVGGSKESVQGISRAMLVDYHQRQYTSGNIAIIVAGNIQPQQVIDSISRYFRNWNNHKPGTLFPKQDNQAEPRFAIETRDTEQAHLCLGFKGVSYSDPDAYPMQLLATLLGEGMSSRLFLQLREIQGLAYDVHTSSTNLNDCGSLITYAGVEPRNTAKAIQSILYQHHLIKESLTEVELHKCKEFLKGRLMLRMEDSRNVAHWIGTQEILTGHIDTIEETVRRIDSVTPEQVMAIARKTLVTSKLNLAIVGPEGDYTGLSETLTL